MAESAISTATADALSGTTDSRVDVTFCTIGESTYYTTDYKKEAVILRLLAQLPSALRVYKDGALTYGVRAGSFLNGATVVNYTASSSNALTDDATNYIYLTAAGTLTKNTTGFPTTPHVPLAEIVTASGAYDPDTAVTDRRCRAAFTTVGAVGIAAGGLGGSVPTRTITLTCGPWYNLVRIWISASNYGAPSATNNTFALTTGTQYEAETANAAYKIISNSSGSIVFDLSVAGGASRYIMVEVDGRIISSGEVTFT